MPRPSVLRFEDSQVVRTGGAQRVLHASARHLRRACLACVLAGCVGTSTGNPTGDPAREPGLGGGEETGSNSEYCRVASARNVGEQEQTPLGFAASDVLTYLIGERQETLRWQAQRGSEYGPESGAQPLSLKVTRTSAPVRLVDYERKEGRGEIGATCDDALEIEVEVTLRTAQGALDETFKKKVEVRGKQVARIFHGIPSKDLGGSFAYTSVSPAGFEFTRLTFDMTFTPYGTAGLLSPTLEMRTSDAVSNAPGSGPLAAWGLAACQTGTAVPLDARVAGYTGQDVLDAFAAMPQPPVRWDDGTMTKLSLSYEPSEQGVCAVLVDTNHALEGKAGTLLLTGTLVAKSDDGRIDGRWQVLATARPGAGGALETVGVELDYRVRRDNPTLADYGISGFDVSSYDSFGVGVKLSVSSQGLWSGDVSVTGFTAPNCPSTPTVDPSGGASSPGCPGSTPTTVAKATLNP
jgi:hypothetical protein